MINSIDDVIEELSDVVHGTFFDEQEIKKLLVLQRMESAEVAIQTIESYMKEINISDAVRKEIEERLSL